MSDESKRLASQLLEQVKQLDSELIETERQMGLAQDAFDATRAKLDAVLDTLESAAFP